MNSCINFKQNYVKRFHIIILDDNPNITGSEETDTKSHIIFLLHPIDITLNLGWFNIFALYLCCLSLSFSLFLLFSLSSARCLPTHDTNTCEIIRKYKTEILHAYQIFNISIFLFFIIVVIIIKYKELKFIFASELKCIAYT